jgi:hypothetical protein
LWVRVTVSSLNATPFAPRYEEGKGIPKPSGVLSTTEIPEITIIMKPVTDGISSSGRSYNGLCEGIPIHPRIPGNSS